MTRIEKRRRLSEIAANQGGYFTAAQARAITFSSWSLAWNGKKGNFERVARGFYRLPEFPALPHEDVIAAWVKAGPEIAVVSNETALSLYELSPIRPKKTHLTLPRRKRPHGDRPQLPGVQIHTISREFPPGDVIRRFGVRLTSPARTLVS